jgi:hypothetical protein
MLSRCANPNCYRELRYLKDGRIYVFATTTGREHFWLCGECVKTMDLVRMNRFEIKVVPRPAAAR